MKRVLIADDHPIMLSGIERLLSGAGFDIVAKLDEGARVLVAIETHRPDVAVLDVAMPGLSGIEILRRLRDAETTTRVVLLTASLDDDALLEALHLRVDGIVLKKGGERLLIQCLEKVAAGGHFIPQELLVRASVLRKSREEDPLRSLSDRERELSELVAHGLRNRTIAHELNLTEGTVKVYLNRIYEKLAVANRTELALMLASQRAGGRHTIVLKWD